MSNKSEKIPVLITTDNTKRGVFFAYVDSEDAMKGDENIIAEEVQMCVYWDTETRGVLGLAANGPTKNCRITSPVKKALIKGVTFIAEVSKDAVKKWKSEPWSN